MPFTLEEILVIPAADTSTGPGAHAQSDAQNLISDTTGQYRARTLAFDGIRVHTCSRRCAARWVGNYFYNSRMPEITVYSGVDSGRCGFQCVYCSDMRVCSDGSHEHVTWCESCLSTSCVDYGECRIECDDCGYTYSVDDYYGCPSCGDNGSGPPQGCALCSAREHGAETVNGCQGTADPRYSGDISLALAVIANGTLSLGRSFPNPSYQSNATLTNVEA